MTEQDIMFDVRKLKRASPWRAFLLLFKKPYYSIDDGPEGKVTIKFKRLFGSVYILNIERAET